MGAQASGVSARIWNPITYALLLLFVFALLPLFYCEWRLRTSGAHSDGHGTKSTMSKDDFAKIVQRLDRQKDQRSAWAYAALVAIVAISVVKKAFSIPWIRVAYVFLGTAGVFMFESIRAGDEYERLVAIMVILPSIQESQFNDVVDLLWLQLRWLKFAAASLLLFVGAFLVAVLSGNVQQEVEPND